MPEDTDHFAVFRLPRRLGIDKSELTAAFLALSRENHPDRFAGAEPSVLADIQRKSARINDAYRVLKNSTERAEHLLALEGVERPEGEAKCPPDLLEEVFELRCAMTEGDSYTALAKAKSLLADTESSLTSLYAEYDEAAGSDAGRGILEKLRTALDRRKFVAGLADETAQR